MVRVKICGNRTLEDALLAVSGGADAIGLIVGVRHESEDALKAETSGEILRAIPPLVSTVLVTHLLHAQEILDILAVVPATTIQLHDRISIEEINALRHRLPHVKLIKAIHVTDRTSIQSAEVFAGHVDALILDSLTRNKIGGTGIVHDWDISREIVQSVNKPVILAGGLTPENVVEAIHHVNPYGVDVNTGVQAPNGRKDPQKVRDFIRLARNAGLR